MPSLVKIGSIVLQKKYISLFSRYNFSMVKSITFLLNTFDFPSPKYALCQAWLKLPLFFLIRRFLNFINLFYYSIIFQFLQLFSFLFGHHLLLEKCSALYLDKLESSLPKHFYAKFGWYWPSDFCEDEMLKN